MGCFIPTQLLVRLRPISFLPFPPSYRPSFTELLTYHTGPGALSLLELIWTLSPSDVVRIPVEDQVLPKMQALGELTQGAHQHSAPRSPNPLAEASPGTSKDFDDPTPEIIAKDGEFREHHLFPPGPNEPPTSTEVILSRPSSSTGPAENRVSVSRAEAAFAQLSRQLSGADCISS